MPLFPATQSSNKGFHLCLGSWLIPLSWLTHCPKNQFIESYTSTKFGLYSYHLPLAWSNSAINLLLVWSMLFLYWLTKRHYLICYWLVKYYNSHSEPVLNKFLPRTISISEHNLPPRNKTEVEFKDANLPSHAWKAIF